MAGHTALHILCDDTYIIYVCICIYKLYKQHDLVKVSKYFQTRIKRERYKNKLNKSDIM